MLLFSLVIQPLLRQISNTRDLEFNLLYVDDGKIGGWIREVHKLLIFCVMMARSSNTTCNQPRRTDMGGR
jgi:hypothetical protein